ISMHMPFPLNAMNVFMDMDKMMGPDFESGLNNMKEYVEANSRTTKKIEIQEVVYPGHIFEAVRKIVNQKDQSQFFKYGYNLLWKDISSKVNGVATGMYFTWDTVNKSAEMAAAFPVTDSTP